MKLFNSKLPPWKPYQKKWILFSFLVFSLGYSLSWNPELTHFARNKSQHVTTMDFAQEAGASPSSDPNLQLGKALNLAELLSDKSLEKYAIKFIKDYKDPKGKTLAVEILKKNAEGGYSDLDCSACFSERVITNNEFNANNLNHLKDLTSTLLTKEKKDKLRSEKETKEIVDSKKKKTPKDFLSEDCQELDAEEVFECQADVITDLFNELEDCKDLQAKSEIASCKSKTRKKISENFKPLESAYKYCASDRASQLNKKSRKLDDELLEEEFKIHCGSVTRAARTLINTSNNDYVLTKSMNLFQALTAKDLNKVREAARNQNLNQESTALLMKNMFTNISGVQTAKQYNPITKVYEDVLIPPSSGYSSTVMQSVLGNVSFRNTNEAYAYFYENFYKNLFDIGREFSRNPINYSFQNNYFENAPSTFNSAEYHPSAQQRGNTYRGPTPGAQAPSIGNLARPNDPPVIGQRPIQPQQPGYVQPGYPQTRPTVGTLNSPRGF